MSSSIRLGVVISMCLLSLVLGCGRGEGAASAAQPPAAIAPRFQPLLPPNALPESMRGLRLGDSTPDDVRIVMGDARIDVHESLQTVNIGPTTMRASFEPITPFNANPRWPYGMSARDRISSSDGSASVLAGADPVWLYFGMVPGRDNPRLVRIDVSGPRVSDATCAALAAVVRPAGVASCPPVALAGFRAGRRAAGRSTIDPPTLGCIGDEEGDLQVAAWCESGAMVLEVIAPATSSPRAPAVATPAPAALAPVVSAPGAVPPNGPGFFSTPNGYIYGTARAIACTRGSYTLTGVQLSTAQVGGTCELTLIDSTITTRIVGREANGQARVTLRNTTIASDGTTSVASIRTSETPQITVQGGTVFGADITAGVVTVSGATGATPTTSFVARAPGRVVDGGGNTSLTIR